MRRWNLPRYLKWLFALCLCFPFLPFLAGCCTSARCLDKLSGPDQERTRATPIKLNTVYNDRVSSPKQDRTDWKSIMVPSLGRLEVQLHWDNEQATLGLTVFNALGAKITEGKIWGPKGIVAEIPKAQPNLYYLRIRSENPEDESTYSLQAIFQKQSADLSCHRCEVGERICLRSDGYVVCEKTRWGCNAWRTIFACPAGLTCLDGRCSRENTLLMSKSPCSADERRCAGPETFEECTMSSAGSLMWSKPMSCPAGRRCHLGKCRAERSRPPRGAVAKPEPSPAAVVSKGHIVSMYRYRGRMTLHIELGENVDVKPGQTGTVLKGETNNALENGEIQVTKIAGRYCIATSSLQKLGKNRWVRFNVR